jgi:hypothetical protein
LIRKIVFFVFILLFLMGCGDEKGRLKIWLIDAPPPQDTEHIYLTVLGVGIRDEAGEALILNQDIHTLDVLRLIGGRAAVLTLNYSNGSDFTDVEPGNYTSVLLFLAQINWVVRDSIQDSLLIPVPQDSSFVYELDEDFTILPGGSLTIVVDFDASKSINWKSEPYELTPHFRIFQSSNAGFITGVVKDTSGAAVKFATVQAVSSSDTMSALSADLDTTYSYCLFIPEGTYDIRASADGYTISDTVYNGVNVIGDSTLEGYDFTLE